jgi:2-polyprenyl-3-methyl-5-hydroxy-6-metoxy-1,4-benzoquinol methylase
VTPQSSLPGACPWCESTTVEIVTTAVCTFRNTTYGFAVCRACDLKFANPFSNADLDYEAIQTRHTGYAVHIADNEWIHAILERGTEPHWTQAAIDFLTGKTMDSRYIPVLQCAVAAAKQQKKLRILEVGCNLGYVAAVLQRLGHHCIGLDVQEEAIAKARLYYGEHYCAEPLEQFAGHTTERFDLICSFEVIEHVMRPREFVDTCVSLLGPQGRLILTTPNGDQMRDEEWLTDFPPIHLTVFRRSTFEKLRPGLNVRLIDDLQHNRPGPHIWERVKRRWRPTHAGPPQVMDPESAAFVYGPNDTAWHMPYVLRPRDIFRRAVADAASLMFGPPVGYCMVVEITKGT